MSTEALNLDVNASYPMPEEVLAELKEFFPAPLNPNSIHSGGQRARALVESARESVSSLLGAKEGDRIIFTSGATESNNMAIHSALEGEGRIIANSESSGCACIASAIEHPSVLEPLANLAQSGISVHLVSCGADKAFAAADFMRRCGPATRIISVMVANNETGQLLPVAQIAKEAHKNFPRALFHSDAVQALGKIPVDFNELGLDMLSISGHKIGALTGIGALLVRDGVSVRPLILGGPQELHARAGTENVLGIVSLGIAARYVGRNLARRSTAMRENSSQFRELLVCAVPGISFLFDLAECLPNTVSAHIPGIKGDDLVVALDLERVYISSGAACASGKPTPSHVLLALGRSAEQASETVRFSIPAEYGSAEIAEAASRITRCIARMRKT